MNAIHLKTGEVIQVVELSDDKATLACSLASPPGATMQCVVSGPAGTIGDFQLKVSRCRKLGEWFHIEGRIRNAARDVRTALNDTDR